jgi:hypothetical protein
MSHSERASNSLISLFKKQYRYPAATMVKEIGETLIDAAANDKSLGGPSRRLGLSL